MYKLSVLKKPDNAEVRHKSVVAFHKDSMDSEGARPRRLTALSEMLQRYSVTDDIPKSRESEGRPSAEIALNELNKLQYLLGTELPNISGISLPSHLSDLLIPRTTLKQVHASLDASKELRRVMATAPWHLNEKLHMHKYIRDMAIKKLEADIFKKLNVTYNNHVAIMKEEENLPSFSIFGWTLQDFITRRQERSMGWIEALLQRSDRDLEMLKFKNDIEELCKLLKLIFKGLKITDAEARQELFTFVHDAHEYLKFPQAFRMDAKQNMEKLREQVNTYLDMWFYKRGTDEEAYKLSLEQRLMNAAVIGPIELRYEVNWMRTKTDQAILRMMNVIEEMEKKAENNRVQESKESYCARCALDMYYLDIESFKRRISALSTQYDTEFEKAENEIVYKKISMDKLNAQRKFLEEQMIRFKDEIEQMRQKEIDEQLAEEQRKEEEQQRALEAELARKKKKNKKKGKKK